MTPYANNKEHPFEIDVHRRFRKTVECDCYFRHMSVCLSVCQSVSLSVCLYVSLSVSQSVSVSVSLSVCLSVSQSVRLSVCPPHLPINLTFCHTKSQYGCSHTNGVGPYSKQILTAGSNGRWLRNVVKMSVREINSSL